jgi:CBS domain-containing protein
MHGHGPDIHRTEQCLSRLDLMFRRRSLMTEVVRGAIRGQGEDAPSSRKFFRVARIIPSNQEILCVPPGTKVRDALDLMNERGFSHLPVVAGETVIGVFTYRSLARNLHSIRSQDSPLDVPVDDLVEDLIFARPEEEVSEILKWVERDGAILLGDDDHLLAIATASDLAQFLWDTTQPFILVRDIELAVRDLIRYACPSQTALQGRISMALPAQEAESHDTTLEDLTLGQVIAVLLQGQNFGQCFRRTFGNNRDLVRGRLESVRIIRNKVFHFTGAVSTREMQSLLSTWRWLERKVVTVEAQH